MASSISLGLIQGWVRFLNLAKKCNPTFQLETTIANKRKTMSELAQKRIDFIALLHEVFLVNKGYGALAYISLPEIINLFDQFLQSGDTADHFINQFVRSV